MISVTARGPATRSAPHGAAENNGTACNDTSLCTSQDACINGLCKGTTTVTCTASDQCHDPGVCNDNTGQCSNPVKPIGSACNDSMQCTYGDSCNAAGACAGTAVACPATTS